MSEEMIRIQLEARGADTDQIEDDVGAFKVAGLLEGQGSELGGRRTE